MNDFIRKALEANHLEVNVTSLNSGQIILAEMFANHFDKKHLFEINNMFEVTNFAFHNTNYSVYDFDKYMHKLYEFEKTEPFPDVYRYTITGLKDLE